MKKLRLFTFGFLLAGAPFFALGVKQNIDAISGVDLTQDTILPIFDNVDAIKNRYIQAAGRIEIYGGANFNITEPFYKFVSFGGGLGYNFSEVHSLHLSGSYILEGLSNNGETLQKGEGNLKNKKFHFDLVPAPLYYGFLDYQLTAWYGKMSIAKNFVANLSFYGFVGPAIIGFSNPDPDHYVYDRQTFGASFGAGNKFYVHKNIALKVDVRLLVYKGPNPIDNEVSVPRSNLPNKYELTSIYYVPTLVTAGLTISF